MGSKLRRGWSIACQIFCQKKNVAKRKRDGRSRVISSRRLQGGQESVRDRGAGGRCSVSGSQKPGMRTSLSEREGRNQQEVQGPRVGDKKDRLATHEFGSAAGVVAFVGRRRKEEAEKAASEYRSHARPRAPHGRGWKSAVAQLYLPRGHWVQPSASCWGSPGSKPGRGALESHSRRLATAASLRACHLDDRRCAFCP